MIEIVVAQDGTWPFVWRWLVEVPLPGRYMSGHRMRGDALTKKRAFAKANRAAGSCEWVRMDDPRLKVAS